MRFPLLDTSRHTPASHTQYLTLDDASTTSTETSLPLLPKGFATITTQKINSKSTRHTVITAPKIVTHGPPTTLITIATPARPTTTTSALLPFTTAVSATQTPAGERPLLAPAEGGLPDWSPLLTVSLLCCVVMAWIVAVVIYFAIFSKKFAWLNGVLGKGGRRQRYLDRWILVITCNYMDFELTVFVADIRRIAPASQSQGQPDKM
jgi:hypothetical protein